MTELDILCVTPSSSGGWGPITTMAHLAGELFETTPRYWHPARAYGRVRKAASLVPQLRRGDRALLLIASHPGDLLALARTEAVLGRYGRVGAWIIDSFWDDRIPRFARGRHGIDALWITDGELVSRYSTATGLDVGWLPWGSDVLGVWQSAERSERTIDVFRLGRQPRAWDDDTRNAASFAQAGLTYQGRFPDQGDGVRNQHEVQRLLRSSKVVLASSPLASPEGYTHPDRDYISARFTDAAAAGTLVAGVPPRCMAAELLPPELLVPVDAARRTTDIAAVVQAAGEYTETRSNVIRRVALERLDWRHRFAEIARKLDVDAPALTTDLGRVRDRLKESE